MVNAVASSSRRRPSLRALIFCCVGVITLVFVATLAASVVGRITVGHALHNLGDRLIPIRNQSSELSRAFVDQETGQRAFLLTGTPIALELYAAGTATVNRLVPELQRELVDMPLADDLRALFRDEVAAAAVWKSRAADPQIVALRTGSIPRTL